MARIRIPLHIKGMLSYLFVVGLVLAPLVFYEATVQLKRAAALGVSAALVLSLIALIDLSRPLRRIVAAVRAFAAGDLGHEVDVRSRDEIGDVGEAMRELAASLRARLVEAGSGRATLHLLLDQLPCGVILFDAQGQPKVISARARELCDLAGAEEALRAAAIGRIFAERIEGPLPLPWERERHLEARWLEVFSDEGRSERALLIIDRTLERQHDEVTNGLNGTVLLLREAARTAPNEDLRLTLENEADRVEHWASWGETETGDITAVALDDLCALAAQQIEARAELKKIKLKFELPDQKTSVAESDGRSCRALRGFLESAIKASKKGANLAVIGEIQNGCVRLSVRTKSTEANVGELAPLVSVAGGEVGAERLGDTSLFWMTIPRA